MKLSAFIVASALVYIPSIAAAQDITDSQIAAIVVTANQVDIDAGKLAKSRAKDPKVKAFAQQMITDHTGVNKSATALVTRLKVTPEQSATSKSLQAGGDANVAKLRTLKGAEFDKAYIDQEVAYHQAVLDAVDQTLIPNAKNEELKALLVKSRPAFLAHLEHAKHVQAQMTSTTK
jgi:putative membrane protein